MYCKKCGTKLDDDSVFCSKCGTRVVLNNNETLSIIDDILSNCSPI